MLTPVNAVILSPGRQFNVINTPTVVLVDLNGNLIEK